MDDAQTSHPYYWAGFALIGDRVAQPTLQLAAVLQLGFESASTLLQGADLGETLGFAELGVARRDVEHGRRQLLGHCG